MMTSVDNIFVVVSTGFCCHIIKYLLSRQQDIVVLTTKTLSSLCILGFDQLVV